MQTEGKEMALNRIFQGIVPFALLRWVEINSVTLQRYKKTPRAIVLLELRIVNC